MYMQLVNVITRNLSPLSLCPLCMYVYVYVCACRTTLYQWSVRREREREQERYTFSPVEEEEEEDEESDCSFVPLARVHWKKCIAWTQTWSSRTSPSHVVFYFNNDLCSQRGRRWRTWFFHIPSSMHLPFSLSLTKVAMFNFCNESRSHRFDDARFTWIDQNLSKKTD